MWTKPYGKTGLDVTAISYGGMRLDNPADIDTNADIVLHAYNRGVNYFDSAPTYCQAKSELIMGEAVKQMDRDKVILSSKSSAPTGDGLMADLEESLRRFGVDALDIYHIWWVTSMEDWQSRLDGGAVAAAIKAKEQGLIKHLALSSHLPGDELGTALQQAPFEGVLLGYCAINFPYREAAVQLAGENDLGVMTMNPLGGGLIPQYADKFDFIRSPGDASTVEAAIRFNVSNPNITSALVGMTTKDHIDQAVDAVTDFQGYSAEHIDKVRAGILEAFDGMCTGCGYCLPCPADIDVPKMMDVYNMLMLRGEAAAAERLKWHWTMPAADAAKCSDCGLCEERCTQHLPIRDRLKEIAVLPEEE